MEKHAIASFDIYAREPILRRMKDGSIICTFLTGGAYEPHNDNVVAIARSEDDGVTWSKPEVLFSHDNRGCWCTEVFTDCERPFAVVHTYNAPSHYRELQTFRSFCDDSGKTWTEPISFRGNINGCSIRQGIRLSNGDMLFPIYWQEVEKNFNWPDKENGWDTCSWPFVSGAAISHDNGETFVRYGDIRAGVSLWEPNAVEVEDGHIIMYCRSNQGALFISESFDYGKTWSEPILSDIPNADTKVTVLKVRGQILMINNFESKAGWDNRVNLCIYKSKDGKNFEKVVCVEDEKERFFYPHAFADEEKEKLYVAYENKKDHWLKIFTYRELGLV
jgi:predicted neuraminidase